MRTALLSAAATLCAAFLASAGTPDGRARILILTGASDLQYHDWRASTPFLKQVLEKTGRFEVKMLEETAGITARTLAGYDGLVLNYNGPRWGQETERAVEEFLRGGRGMIAVHGVSYGEFFGMRFAKRWQAGPTRGWEAYRAMLGMDWKPENIGHAPRHVFQVRWTDREHPIASGLPPEFEANDELYHRMDLRPEARVLAAAYDDPKIGGTGKDEPVLWVVPFGRGRVVHFTLGHDTAAMYQPGFQAAFARGAEWAATGTVAPAAPAARPAAVRVLVITGGHAYPASFFTLFEGWDDIAWTHAGTEQEAFRPKLLGRYDTIVLHNLHPTIGEAAQARLREFVEGGGGVVSIHHAIANYPQWPWWYEEVVGGLYFTSESAGRPRSQFKEDVEMLVEPAAGAARHPVLRGVGPLPLVDEVYKGMWHSPRIQVLMETRHPLNDRPAVYIGPPHPRARAVYIQPGHGEYAFRHPGYRRLVHNAILWAARRLE